MEIVSLGLVNELCVHAADIKNVWMSECLKMVRYKCTFVTYKLFVTYIQNFPPLKSVL
jgi:hypothetical protein